MAREGTRSATGNSRPRVFPIIAETTPITKKQRATANTGAKRGPKKPAAAKPVGVPKKTPVKKSSVTTKIKGTMKKAEGAITTTANPKADIPKIKGADVISGKKVAATRKK